MTSQAAPEPVNPLDVLRARRRPRPTLAPITGRRKKRGALAATDILGSTTPRLYTPPLVTGKAGPCGCGCALTPETSFGFDLIDFARDVVGVVFDPWERWLSIHAGELLPDGRPRFRIVLLLVARQNGKSIWGRCLILFWIFVDLAGERGAFILGTSTDRSYAKKFWLQTGELIEANPILRADLAGIRRSISEEAIVSRDGVEYGFAANNGSAARSRTLWKAFIDEIREHHNLDAWAAIKGAMNAVYEAQAVCASNQGDDTAVLLDALRDPAVSYIETGEGDDRLGLFEYSSPAGAEPDDLAALAQANPNLGRRLNAADILADARRAKRAGGEELAKFRTEVMCQRVALLDPAIDPEAWKACGTSTPVDLAEHRNRVALVLEVSLDKTHATLTAAADIDGTTTADVVAAWDDLAAMRAEMPAIVARVKPRRFGYLPGGPAAAYAAELGKRKGWPPRGTELVEITTETAAVCMALPPLVNEGKIRHARDPLQDAHVARAQRVRRGDRWVYGRQGSGPVDAVYALAGAVYLARTMPPPRPALAVV